MQSLPIMAALCNALATPHVCHALPFLQVWPDLSQPGTMRSRLVYQKALMSQAYAGAPLLQWQAHRRHVPIHPQTRGFEAAYACACLDPPSFAEDFLQQFVQLATAMCADPQQRIYSYSLLTETARLTAPLCSAVWFVLGHPSRCP